MKIVDVLKQYAFCAKRMSVWAWTLVLSSLFVPFNGLSATNDTSTTSHIHQEYDGPWHWDELTRTRKSLAGSYYESYEVITGWADSGTAVITGRKEPVANMTVPSKIKYNSWTKGPWGVDDRTVWLSLLTVDFDIVEIGEEAFFPVIG